MKYLIVTEDGQIWGQDKISDHELEAFHAGIAEIVDLDAKKILAQYDNGKAVWSHIRKCDPHGLIQELKSSHECDEGCAMGQCPVHYPS